MFRDIREYARSQLPPGIDSLTRTIAESAIDEALYGLMMVADGVTGSLSNVDQEVRVRILVDFTSTDKTTESLDLFDGDGTCMAYHSWVAGDFGRAPIVED